MSGDNTIERTPKPQNTPQSAQDARWARFAGIVVLDSPKRLGAFSEALRGLTDDALNSTEHCTDLTVVPLLAGQPDRQTVIVEATALLNELALVFRAYEKHHRAKVPEDAKPGTAEWVQHSDAMAKSERNAGLAERVETMLHRMLVPYQTPVMFASREAADALYELVEVSRLRGDNELPAPPDDPKTWTARAIDAWAHAEEVVDRMNGGQ